MSICGQRSTHHYLARHGKRGHAWTPRAGIPAFISWMEGQPKLPPFARRLTNEEKQAALPAGPCCARWAGPAPSRFCIDAARPGRKNLFLRKMHQGTLTAFIALPSSRPPALPRRCVLMEVGPGLALPKATRFLSAASSRARKQAGAGGHFVAEVPRREALDMEKRHAELAFLTMDELAAFCDIIPARAAVRVAPCAGPWIFYKMRAHPRALGRAYALQIAELEKCALTSPGAREQCRQAFCPAGIRRIRHAWGGYLAGYISLCAVRDEMEVLNLAVRRNAAGGRGMNAGCFSGLTKPGAK